MTQEEWAAIFERDWISLQNERKARAEEMAEEEYSDAETELAHEENSGLEGERRGDAPVSVVFTDPFATAEGGDSPVATRSESSDGVRPN